MIAVCGLDALLPGAPDGEAWIAASRAGQPAFSDVPAGRWPFDPRRALDPRPGHPDATPTLRGAFVDDPGGSWVERVTRRALGATRYDPARTDLFVANLSLPSTGMVRAVSGPWRRLLHEAGVDTAFLEGTLDELHHSQGPALDTARALGLGGFVTALDAACASGLYAVRLACDRLEARQCDTAIAAAVNRSDSAFLFLGFAQLRALSRSGRSRPLDRRGDGLLVGEGAAAVVLKRLDDALRDGDRVHAVIRGGGLGNDGKKGNLLAPRLDGELRAMRAAWRRAGLDPATVGYVECHATGTPVGDRTEVEALGTLLAEAREPVVLASAKSLIGHTVTAAGLAGLIRAVGAVRDGFFPPIDADEPLEGIGDRLRVLGSPTPWEAKLRRAAVSAFGFGGTNAHIVVESAGEPAFVPHLPVDEELAIVAMAARIGEASGDQLRDALLRGRSLLGPDGARVGEVVVDPRRWRMPPVELADMLPQQLLFLDVATTALADVPGLDPERTGAIVGMGTDPRIADHVVRWAAGPFADEVAPPLTSTRVQGVLPNFVANRISAALDLQGPSYTVSAGRLSGPAALVLASRLLANGEVDAVLVGAVDVGATAGAVEAEKALDPAYVPGEGAVAMVVRRLSDAQATGEPILAIVSARMVAGEAAPPPHRGLTGDVGAADGLVAVLHAAWAVRDRVHEGRAWLKDEAAPPRQIEAIASEAGRRAEVSVREGTAAARPVGERPKVLGVRGDDPHALAAALRAGERPATGRIGVAVIGDRLDLALAALDAGRTELVDPRGVYIHEKVDGKVAFVFPGTGSAYEGMGRSLLPAFPAAHDRLASTTRILGTQTGDAFADEPADAVGAIFASAWLSLWLADIVQNELGLHPDAILGVSLGESVGLCASGAWQDRDELFARISTWPLFTTALAGPMEAAAQTWREAGIDPGPQPIYASYVVNAPRAAVEAACAAEPGVSVLVVNTPDEIVVGGPRLGVERALAAFVDRVPAPSPAMVHCPEVSLVADEYLRLHTVPTHPVDVEVWSAAAAAPYEPTSEAAAQAIVAQALATVDLPRLFEAAWQAGIRTFVEVGPRGACTRWIDRILGDRPHLAVATDRKGGDGLMALAHAAAELYAAGLPVDLGAFAAEPAREPIADAVVVRRPAKPSLPGRAFRGSFGGETVPVALPRREPVVVHRVLGAADPAQEKLAWKRWIGEPTHAPPPVRPTARSAPPPPPAPPAAVPPSRPAARHRVLEQEIAGLASLAQAMAASADAVADAHLAFLDGQQDALERIADIGRMLDRAGALIQSGASLPTPPRPAATPTPAAIRPIPVDEPDPPRTFDREALVRFATGPLSSCLGPSYRDLDGYEPRTRLPSDPLLLVTRVLNVEGERGRFGPSRIVTEYDIPADAWWSHDGKAPPCVIVESGQADLFLVSYLGVDALCRGKRLYRLLDCDLTFHGSRPRLGETLRHDIRIERFARLGDTTLFYFQYDCVVPADGRRVLTMRHGCAGFFTPDELSRPQGVIAGEEAPSPNRVEPWVRGAPSTLDERAVEALAAGHHGEALGAAFVEGDTSGLRLPPAPWRLVHRVRDLRTAGGPHGLGGLVVEQDLRDDDWFNACHFQGDPCMPGTLMFDGCMQALSLWMTAMGFATRYRDATFEPIADRTCRLRCRGQVIPGHRQLEYEVRVKEAGLEPHPWAVADVILHVDGTAVVRAEDVSVRIDGELRPDARPQSPVTAVDRARVIEFSVGDPSRAFGPAFAPFDADRRTARMPGQPILQMTRVLDVEGPAGVMAADRTVTIAYDVPADAWFWRASPHTSMPFAVLLEIALQPCGWLTAWQQASLQSGDDLYFRNLDGKATWHAQVWPHTGTLITRAKQTTVARSGGMVVHGFALTVHAGETLVFEGTTRFGYFTRAALANQKGLQPPADEEARRAALRERIALLPAGGPGWPRDDLRMVDRLGVDESGGRAGLGYWVGAKDVDREEWFFTAHFHQDPVMPGSLGLEALGQIAQQALIRRLGRPVTIEPVASGTEVEWKYRGQVPPDRHVVGFEVEVLGFEEEDRVVVVDAMVRADGLPIYELRHLRVRAVEAPERRPPSAAERPPPTMALLDRFEVDGARGQGVLRLDPAVHPWLRDHCPTVVIPAVPMAFAAEIAAEAASRLAPGRRVVGIPVIEARKWIAVPDEPVDLLIEARLEGDQVEVTLGLFKVNERFPKLSGAVTHMRAVARLGEDWPEPPPAAPDLAVTPVGMSVREYYDGGHTFHGPVLQGMTAVGERGPEGAIARFHTRPDAELLGLDAAFVLDPLLLDTATHPMMSGMPEIRGSDVPSGRLAYPVLCEQMVFYGPRPSGEVSCRLDRVVADADRLVFDVRLTGATGLWCSFRWTEALVEGGPVLGLPAEVRRPFCWEEAPDPRVHVGRAHRDGWQVCAADLVEPLEGTIVRLWSTSSELDELRAGASLLGRLAAKEAVRQHLAARLGRDVHPRALVVFAMRPDRYVVAEAPTLTAQEYIDHLGPTRFDLVVHEGPDEAVAQVVPKSGP